VIARDPLPPSPHAGKTCPNDSDRSPAAIGGIQQQGDRHVDAAQSSSKKKRRVYVHISEDTRERLKVVAAFKGLLLFDALETICNDYVRGWEKLHKIDIDKLRETESKQPRKSSRSKA
jgi:hypothetical protein